MTSKTFEIAVTKINQGPLCDILSQQSGLSKQKIKRAMNHGAVWIQTPKQKKRRIRRASASAMAGSALFLYYDEEIINSQPPEAHCLKDYGNYGIWFKPAGLLTQGTNYGDHCALSRQVEQFYQGRRKIFIVHRLDREVAGVIILAYNTEAAHRLSRLFQDHQIQKHYQVWVKGNISDYRDQDTIDFPIDQKPAITHYKKTDYHPVSNQSLLDVTIETGYTHQIRVHLNLIGYPVIGDPRYGSGNKNKCGLKLVAYAIAFQCPFKNVPIKITIDTDQQHP